MISFGLSSELEMFQKTALSFAHAQLRSMARDLERAMRIPAPLAQAYWELGLAAVEVPENLGGLGQGLVGKVVVEEALAQGDLGVALGMPSPGAFAQAVLCLGGPEHRRYLSALVQAQGRGAIAWSEPAPKLNAFSSTAVEQADGSFVLSGHKSQVLAADEAQAIVFFAQLQDRENRSRPAAFVMTELPESQVRFSQRKMGLGLNAAPLLDMHVEGLKVPPEARLQSERSFDEDVVRMVLRQGVVGAARAVGLAAASFEYAVGYASERTAFGKPIAHFQGLAFTMAEMATRLEAMRALVHQAAWGFDHEAKRASLNAAMAIAECHEGAMEIANHSVQILGGAGFVEDHPVEKWMRDAKAHMAHAMPHALCDLLIGRAALTGLTPSMEHDAPWPQLQPVFL